MEYRKIMNLLENKVTQPSKFRKKHWPEINDGVHGTCYTSCQIESNTLRLRSSLCD